MAKKAQLTVSPKMWALYLFLAFIFVSGGLLAWNYDWSKLKFDYSKADKPPAQITECPKTSAERGQPCCKQLASGVMQASVGALYVPVSCKKCPDDTRFLRYAPESKNIMICKCNACPN